MISQKQAEAIVLYDAELAGQHVKITLAEMLQNETVAAWFGQHGIRRMASSAATNAKKGEGHQPTQAEKEQAVLKAFQTAKAGEKPARGGGGLDPATHHRRQVLAEWAAHFHVMSLTDAKSKAGKDPDNLAQAIAKAVKEQQGQKVENLAESAKNLLEKYIEPEVQKRMKAADATQVDI